MTDDTGEDRGVDRPRVDSETGYPADPEDPYPEEWDEPANNRKAPSERDHVSTSIPKRDAVKMVTGEARFTADYDREFPDAAVGTVRRSEVANGVVTAIDTSAAEAMDGVYAVITPDSDVVPDKKYTSTGQGFVEPSPWDMTVLSRRVRHVGDPIAAVAARDAHTADRAARAVDVEYEEREPLLDPERAMDPDAPQLFDPDEVENAQPGSDYERNRHSSIEGEIGDVDAGLRAADYTFETTIETPYQNHLVPEPHAVIAYTDEDGRYNCISSTQVPYHTRRQLARLFDVPVRDVRVRMPRLGSTFGSKQGMIVEPIAMALSLAADRPVILEATRAEEFYALRNRHPMTVSLELGVDEDGTFRAADLYALSNTGAYGPHGMTVAGNVGTKTLPLYPRMPNARFEADIVHTNLPVAGAYRGYGAPQGHMAVETLVDDVAAALDVDPIELRRTNHVREGDLDRMAGILGGSAEGVDRRIRSCGIPEVLDRGMDAIGWDSVEQPADEDLRRGIGVALVAQGSGVAGDELGAAHVKMNEDGSFVLEIGGLDIGTGVETAFTQIVAEVLGCRPEDVVVLSADTDVAPFDYGTYASSTTFISGQAAKKAAEDAKASLLGWAGTVLDESPANLVTADREVRSTVSGESITFEELGTETIYGHDERGQIMGQASHSTDESPPPFGAQFVDVTVDATTGEFELNKLVFAADVGVALNPALVEGQIEGGQVHSLEYAIGGGLDFEDDGTPVTTSYRDYDTPTASEIPPMESIVVETHEPTGPFGAKSIAELPMNGVPPALSNAVRDAVGVRVRSLPITPAKIRAQLAD